MAHSGRFLEDKTENRNMDSGILAHKVQRGKGFSPLWN